MHRYICTYNICAIFVILICCVCTYIHMLYEKVKFHFVPETNASTACVYVFSVC